MADTAPSSSLDVPVKVIVAGSVDLTPFDQVAGHATGPLTRFYAKNGKIYKPSQAGSRGDREAYFYEHTLKEIPDFSKFTPKFYGMELLEFPNEVHEQKHKFIVMEDLTYNYDTNYLCVADIKLGVVTYDAQATEKKRNYEIEKAASTTTVTLGFRVCGLKVYEEGFGLKKYNKDFGKNLTERNVQEGLETFFPNPKLRAIVVPQFTAKLYELLDWFENNTTYLFIGTSLLLLYDGKLEPEATEKQVDVKVIDYAHIDKTGRRDEGYIFGLKNLIKVFEAVESAEKAKATL
jgi:1D-myo-inositol-tetrakisphosphate 5-kinase/inositol-polyphosphate multikinase